MNRCECRPDDLHLSCRLDNVALPEVHTGLSEEATADELDAAVEAPVTYETLAVPEIHCERL